MQDADSILSLLASGAPEDIREGAQRAGDEKLTEAIPVLVEHLKSTNVGVQDAVDNALRQIGGGKVVHAVLPLLRSDNAPSRNLAMDILRALVAESPEPVQLALQDDDPDVRIFAADILGSAGTSLVVADLCEALLHDPEVNVRYQAAVSLGVLGIPSSVTCLTRALNDEEWVQFSVIEALTKMRATSSINALLQVMDSSSDLVASTVVDALGEMGDMKAVPLLLRRLDSAPTPLANKIVKAIISILGERNLSLLGTKDCTRLRGYMVTALEDEDTAIQDAAIRGFAILGGKEAAAGILQLASNLNPDAETDRLLAMAKALAHMGMTPALEQAVNSPQEHVQQLALAALVRMESVDTVPLLKDVFMKGSREVQRNTIYTLAQKAGPDEQDFFLQILAQHQDGNVIRGCLSFLGEKGDAEKVQEMVFSFFGHPYSDVKEAALNAAIALDTPRIREFCRGLLVHQDPVQRMMGVYALGMLNPAEYSDELLAALEDVSPDVRKVAVKAVGATCSLSNEHFALLQQKMSDENREVRLAAIEALAECPHISLEACLLQGLDDSDPWVRVRCIEKLGEQRELHTVPRLVFLLHDPDNLVVIKTIDALGRIGGETAFRALMELLNHPDKDLQVAAEEAIEAIRSQAGE